MKKLFFALVSVLFCSSACAATWLDLEGAEGFDVQIDVDSIAPVDNSLIKAWVSHSFKEWQMTQEGHIYYKSALHLAVYDCLHRTAGISQEVFYLGENRLGKVVRSSTYQRQNWGLSDVVPGSVGEGTLDFACKSIASKRKK